MNPESTGLVRLSIGNLNLDLYLTPARLADGFTSQYQDFLRQSGTGFPIHIEWSASEITPNPVEAQLTFGGETLSISAVFCQGIVELASAILTLEANNPYGMVEYFLRIVVGVLAFRAGGVMFHGAGILHQGKGYVFFGPSGSGKSTVAYFSSANGDVVMNDDLLVLYPREDEWVIYATPFWNPTQVRPNNRQGILKGMYRLVKDSHVYLEDMTPGQAVGELVGCSPILPVNEAQTQLLLERCLQLSRAIPIFWLHLRRDNSFWKVIDC